MTFPTQYAVGLHRYVAGAANDHGNPVKSYNPAKNLPGLQVRVVQWAPTQMGLNEPEADSTAQWLDLFVPEVLRDVNGNQVADIGPYDLVDLPEGQFEVDGPAWDYTKGFHGWRAGKVVKLKRRTG